MALGIGTRCVCLLFCIFNLLIWILGAIVIGVGVFICVQAKTWQHLVSLDLLVPAILLVVAGKGCGNFEDILDGV